MSKEELEQRLIELLEQCSCPYSPPCTSECHECNKVEMYDKEIANIADHLIANGVTIRERGEWIPVTERLPTDFNDVLIFTMWRTMDVCFFDKEYKCWVSTNGSYDKDCITHWMPLPEPPETEKGGD